MGISQLSKVIADHAPKAIKESAINTYFGRKIAIDASMSIYQFLIAVRSEGNVLSNSEGKTTSHLMGMFYRTLRMVENGIKPVYVFDGKPPELKSGELAKRLEKREDANRAHEEAVDAGHVENADKFNKRSVKVTKEHNDDCKALLTLMGIPWIDAPSEAEAQCAELAKGGKVYAAGSEDMDTLTFGSPILTRHLTFSESRKMPIVEIHLAATLEGLGMSMDEFIDLCILLGCDYCGSIKGIGPQKAVTFIKQYKNIEAVLENIDTTKYPPPSDWQYKEARELFKSPTVIPADKCDLQWTAPDVEGIVKFMVTDHGFDEKRVRTGIDKLTKNIHKPVQGRIDSFFGVKVTPISEATDITKRAHKTEKNQSVKKKKK